MCIAHKQSRIYLNIERKAGKYIKTRAFAPINYSFPTGAVE